MNRREALAALTGLPTVARIAVARLTPSDVIVVESDELLSQQAVQDIADRLHDVWPDQKILVLDARTHLKIVASASV